MKEDQTIPARIRQMRYEAPSILSVELEALQGQPLPPASPGAHIELFLPGDMRRSYSLCATGLEACPNSYVVAVHRDPDSRGGSAHVHEKMRPGDQLQITPPRNHFPLVEEAAQSVLIAGGIGITPILSMARRLARLGRDWTLYYCARNRSAAAFLPELEELATQGGGTLILHFDDEQSNRFLDFSEIFAAAPQAHFYCCGPTPMLAAYKEAGRAVPASQLHAEYFTAAEEAARDGGFEVVLQKSGKTLEVPEGSSILEVLLENKISVPFSCSDGVCGTCETRVLEGMPDHRDAFLTDAERAEGKTMMICCSGSCSSRLVLDL